MAASLAGFLSGYLHKDWDLEFRDWEHAVAHLRQTDPTNAAAVRLELAALVLELGSDAEAEAIVHGMGGYFAPDGSTLEWLHHLHAAFSSEE